MEGVWLFAARASCTPASQYLLFPLPCGLSDCWKHLPLQPLEHAAIAIKARDSDVAEAFPHQPFRYRVLEIGTVGDEIGQSQHLKAGGDPLAYLLAKSLSNVINRRPSEVAFSNTGGSSAPLKPSSATVATSCPTERSSTARAWGIFSSSLILIPLLLYAGAALPLHGQAMPRTRLLHEYPLP